MPNSPWIKAEKSACLRARLSICSVLPSRDRGEADFHNGLLALHLHVKGNSRKGEITQAAGPAWVVSRSELLVESETLVYIRAKCHS